MKTRFTLPLGYSAKAGVSRFKVKTRLGPGRYKVSAVATDAAGNRSATKRSRLTVRR